MKPEDIEITRLRHGGGNGGQNKNKVETAIRATHKPTGVTVVSCGERSQQANLKEAVRRLTGKLEALRLEDEATSKRERRDNAPKAVFGSGDRIRTYYFHRENVARDHRTGLELPIEQVMNGKIDEFLEASLMDELK